MRFLFGWIDFRGTNQNYLAKERFSKKAQTYLPHHLDVHELANAYMGFAHDEDTSSLVCRRGDYVLLFDGRLDDLENLKGLLSLSRREQYSDEELVFLAFEKWGTDFAQNLLGDFAIILFHVRTQEVLLVRDSFGCRPLYYHYSDGAFVWSSELPILLAYPGLSREKSKLWISEYLSGYLGDTETTFYSTIKRLPAGHQLQISSNREFSMQSYWRPQANREIRLKNEEEYVEAFREIFDAVISDRTRGVDNFATMLSGGLDSSSITAVANGHALASGKKLHAFSWALEVGDEWMYSDEREKVEAFLLETPIHSHRYVTGSDVPYFDDNDLSTSWRSRPSGDLRHYYGEETSKLVQERGAKVLLSGEFGDFSVSGHGHDFLLGLLLQGRWIKLLEELFAEKKVYNKSIRSLIRKQLFFPFQSKWQGRRFFYSFGDLPSSISGALASFGWLKKEYLEASGLDACVEKTKPVFKASWKKPVNAIQEYILNQATIQKTIEEVYHRSRIYGYHTVFPMLDRRIIEFCLNIPADQQRGQGWRRWLLRRAMSGVMSEEVTWRVDKVHTVPDIPRRFVSEFPKVFESIERWKRNEAITQVICLEELSRALLSYKKTYDDGEHWGRKVPFSRLINTLFYCQYIEHHG